MNQSNQIYWQTFSVNKEDRASQKNQRGSCLWLTGLSGAGKTTIANSLDKHLYQLNKHCFVLDGDNVRHGLNKDLGFSGNDRTENLRRVAEVSKLMVEAGLIVIVSFISPFKKDRDFARSLFSENAFIEIFIDTPLEECEERDVKGLYAKARTGEVQNFTGINSPYERPVSPEIHLNTNSTPDEAVNMIMSYLKQHSML
jgi:bifunctional enzyme CysN/CysC